MVFSKWFLLLLVVPNTFALECDCLAKSILEEYIGDSDELNNLLENYNCESGFLRVTNTTDPNECYRVAKIINNLPGVYNVKCIDDYLSLDLNRSDSPRIYWDVLDSIELGVRINGISTRRRGRKGDYWNYIWVEHKCEELALFDIEQLTNEFNR